MRLVSVMIIAGAVFATACSKDPPAAAPPHSEPATKLVESDAATKVVESDATPVVQDSCDPTPSEGVSCTVSGKHCAVPGMCEPCQRCLIMVCEAGRWTRLEEAPDPEGCGKD